VLAFAGQVGMAERNSGRVADTGAEARWRNQLASVAAGVGCCEIQTHGGAVWVGNQDLGCPYPKQPCRVCQA
jgi:hypothetical protein